MRGNLVWVMMRVSPVQSLLFGLVLTTAARAEGPSDILDGYGKAHWGQSVAEVMKLYPGMTEPKPAELQAEPSASIPSGSPTLRSFTCPAVEPLHSFVFEFRDDQLVSVEAIFSKEVANKITGGELAKLIWAKYYGDREMRGKLDGRQVQVRVFTNSGSDISVDLSSIVYNSTSNPPLAVRYLNGMLAQKIQDEARARRREALDKNAAELKLSESL